MITGVLLRNAMFALNLIFAICKILFVEGLLHKLTVSCFSLGNGIHHKIALTRIEQGCL